MHTSEIIELAILIAPIAHTIIDLVCYWAKLKLRKRYGL